MTAHAADRIDNLTENGAGTGLADTINNIPACAPSDVAQANQTLSPKLDKEKEPQR